VCRALVESGPTCRRCRADLGLLFALEDERASALATAEDAVARGQWAEAIAHADRALELRHGADACSLLALGHALGRDFAGAWRWYVQALHSSAVADPPESRDNG
jgi:hypothetical protein